MAEIIVKYREFSEEEQQYWRDFYEEIRKHDEATALGNARREGRAEGRAFVAANTLAMIADAMRKNGFTEEQIKELLGDDYTG